MRKGRIEARIAGYIYLEIAGRLEVTRYKEEGQAIRVLSFQSIDANFEFEDLTEEGVDDEFSALVVSAKVRRTKGGDETLCTLEVF